MQPPAGCFSVKLVLVAALTEDTFPELDEASIATLASLDEELANLNATRYVDRSKPQRLLIYLFHNGKCLCGLVYTGSEINLISEEAAAFANLPRQPLPRPKKISLALQAGKSTSLVLQHSTTAGFVDPLSGLQFCDVTLNVGPIVGSHHMILGIPFLSAFSLSVSIPPQSLRCEKSGHTIQDYWKCNTTLLSTTQSEIPMVSQEPESFLRRLKDAYYRSFRIFFLLISRPF